jgi:hypothetical protein
LLKGADVSARDFSSSQHTAFGLACRQVPHTMIAAEHAFQISETLRILLNNGHDIVISHEVDNDLCYLYDLDPRTDVKGQQALLRTAVTVFNNYISSISCDGLLLNIDVHQHTQECLTFYASEFGQIPETEDITLDAIARLMPQTLQAVFLKFIDDKREGLSYHTHHLTTKLINSIGNLHYKALVWIKDDHNNWMSTTISPLELASRSIHTWDAFQWTLEIAGISWLGFIEDALKMPDCKWCPNMLRALSEIRYMDYVEAMSLKWPQFHKWFIAEVEDGERTSLNELFQWDRVLADLERNEPLRSVETGILQRLDRFAHHMSHHEDSEASGDEDDEMTNEASDEERYNETSDEERNTEISDEQEDSESSDEQENSESSHENEVVEILDEDGEVDLYRILQQLKVH